MIKFLSHVVTHSGTWAAGSARCLAFCFYFPSMFPLIFGVLLAQIASVWSTCMALDRLPHSAMWIKISFTLEKNIKQCSLIFEKFVFCVREFSNSSYPMKQAYCIK